jgi:metal-sulfur cluster biosynthetic enzyme
VSDSTTAFPDLDGFSASLPPDVRRALSSVIDPCSAATGAPLSLLEMGLIKRAEKVDDRVEVDLKLTAPICWNAAPMMEAIEQAVRRECSVDIVVCVADHGLDWTPADMTPSAHKRLQLLRPVPQRHCHG